MNKKSIIVGVDFSQSSHNAMRHAVSIALKSNAELHLVWVKTPGVANNVTEDGGDNYLQKVQANLESWKDECRMEAPDVQVNTVILEGKVHTEILKYAANQPIPMIVMGTHGTSGFEEGYIGIRSLGEFSGAHQFSPADGTAVLHHQPAQFPGVFNAVKS